MSDASSPAPELAQFRAAVLAKIRRDLAEEAATSARLREQRLAQLLPLVSAARAEGVCGVVLLFGSYAWGQPTEQSDLDLLVEGDADELAWRVSHAIGCEVDAWRVADAPSALALRARSEGISL